MKYHDTECPYCGTGVNINHDDGYGYEQDVTHNQECPSCNKTFTFTTYISFHYETGKADCLNGGEHKWKPTLTYPPIFAKMECDDCGERRELTPMEMSKIPN